MRHGRPRATSRVRLAADASAAGYLARTESTNAASSSAIVASWNSTMFSAFRSPERERLNDPQKTVSSATVSFACM